LVIEVASWAVSFVPEIAPALDVAWTPAAQSSTLANDRWRLTLSTTNGQGFYRLRR
jgi:hypothetical protein